MKITFWGTRGSIPVPGLDTLKYGGNTPCVEIRSSSDQLIILDAGSGIRELGNFLVENNFKGNIDIFISHYHWDHIQGLPFFKPFYDPDTYIRFYGIHSNGMDIRKVLGNQMMPNNFPVKLEDVSSNKSFNVISKNSEFQIGSIEIKTFQSNHPSPTLVFKIKENDRCFIYVTDNEICLAPGEEGTVDEILSLNEELINFCKGADYLIHDVMYDEPSFLSRKGWGHSGNISAAYLSIFAEVKNLVLFHYNPDYSDEKIDQLKEEINRLFNERKKQINCIPSKEGMVLEI